MKSHTVFAGLFLLSITQSSYSQDLGNLAFDRFNNTAKGLCGPSIIEYTGVNQTERMAALADGTTMER